MQLLANPGLPLWPYLVCAALAGLGGGNFASSMTNINAFYPQRLKGWALALNAGGGNLGVPMVQFVGLLVIAAVGDRQPYWVCAVYLVLLAIAGIGAALAHPGVPLESNAIGRRVRPAGQRDCPTAIRCGQLHIGTRCGGGAGTQPRVGYRGPTVGSTAH
jgi:nitrate/nitrite transporter NarK